MDTVSIFLGRERILKVIPRNVANVSLFIKEAAESSLDKGEIHLEIIEPYIFDRIIPLLEEYTKHPFEGDSVRQILTPDHDYKMQYVPGNYLSIMEKNMPDLNTTLSVLIALDYLAASALTILVCGWVASAFLAGKSEAQLRKIYGIDDQFTDEEKTLMDASDAYVTLSESMDQVPEDCKF